jgi:hypothetical protein
MSFGRGVPSAFAILEVVLVREFRQKTAGRHGVNTYSHMESVAADGLGCLSASYSATEVHGSRITGLHV